MFEHKVFEPHAVEIFDALCAVSSTRTWRSNVFLLYVYEETRRKSSTLFWLFLSFLHSAIPWGFLSHLCLKLLSNILQLWQSWGGSWILALWMRGLLKKSTLTDTVAVLRVIRKLEYAWEAEIGCCLTTAEEFLNHLPELTSDLNLGKWRRR